MIAMFLLLRVAARRVASLIPECPANDFALPLDPLTNYSPGGDSAQLGIKLEGNWLYGITCEIDDFDWWRNFGYAHIHSQN
jgi:hypothetical protein